MKSLSSAKIEANRSNSLLSTGPKTARGKQTSSKNSLTHGLLSKDAVIKTGELREDERVYDEFHMQLVEDLKPQGLLEELLVKEIADCYWRLRRMQRAEVGEITKQFK